MRNTTEYKTLQLIDEQQRRLKEQSLIEEGIWDRTKAKAAGVGAFLRGSSRGRRSMKYQFTAQNKLINNRILKLNKIISELERDIIKMTGSDTAAIRAAYPDIYAEIDKLIGAVSTRTPATTTPAPSLPTFGSALNDYASSLRLTPSGITEGQIPAFLDYLSTSSSDKIDILAVMDRTGSPKNRGKVVSNVKKDAIKTELERKGYVSP